MSLIRSVCFGLFALAAACLADPAVLIVADEIPAMETLAKQLKQRAGVDSEIVVQTKMPKDLSVYRAVIVYIHTEMGNPAERAFIQYTKDGGRLILLHHSISSQKRRNQYWTPFVGVVLPWGAFEEGGYYWRHPVTIELVNLAGNHYIATNGLQYDKKLSYKSPATGGKAAELPGFALPESEVYLNHVLQGTNHKILFGLRYTDDKTGTVYMQDTAGWIRDSGKGTILYFMPGHSVAEFDHPLFAQIVANAVTWDGSAKAASRR